MNNSHQLHHHLSGFTAISSLLDHCNILLTDLLFSFQPSHPLKIYIIQKYIRLPLCSKPSSKSPLYAAWNPKPTTSLQGSPGWTWLRTQEEWGSSSRVKVEGKKNVPAWRFPGRKFCLYWRKDQPFVLFRPSTDWMRPTHMRGAICFTQSTNFNVKLIQKHSQKNNQDKMWPTIWPLMP